LAFSGCYSIEFIAITGLPRWESGKRPFADPGLAPRGIAPNTAFPLCFRRK
jgi:hypothetical protein